MQAATHEFVAADLTILALLLDQEADEADGRRVSATMRSLSARTEKREPSPLTAAT